MEQADQQQDPDVFEHPTVLENTNPNIFYTIYATVTGVLQLYGWYILIAAIVVIYVGSKLMEYYDKQKQRLSDSNSKKYDANETYQRHADMDAARMRMQQQHENMAEKFSEEEKKKEEEKRKNKIEDWQRHQEGKGYRSKIRTPDTDEAPPRSSAPKKNVYKTTTDNGPLSGYSGGAGFRPARRGGAGGGG